MSQSRYRRTLRGTPIPGGSQALSRLSGSNSSPGMGVLPVWLAQGAALAITGEVISGGFRRSEPKETEIEREIKARELASKLENPFHNAQFASEPTTTYLVDKSTGKVDVHKGRPGSNPGVQGLGLAQQLSTTALDTAVGAGTGGVLTATTISAGGSAAGSSWMAAFGGPIGLSVMGATIALQQLWGWKKRRAARKIATTEVVNSVEPVLKQNLNGYFTGPRTISSQRQAVENFQAAWDFVVSSCDHPDMGTPGKWCVEDRQRGGEWDWFARYLDPIANDPDVVPDPAPGFTVQVDPETGERYQVRDTQTATGLTPFLLGLGVIALGFMIGGDGKGKGKR
jgi:hypothetical protein